MADKPKMPRPLSDYNDLRFPKNVDDAFKGIDWYRDNAPGESLRPRKPGETLHIQDDEGAQSLQDAMRLRMQLPR
jgi:hypothetical protein